MITGVLSEGGVLYIFTSVPQMPATSILTSALSSGISGMGKSRICVLLGPTLTAASTFSTHNSSRCQVPEKPTGCHPEPRAGSPTHAGFACAGMVVASCANGGEGICFSSPRTLSASGSSRAKELCSSGRACAFRRRDLRLSSSEVELRDFRSTSCPTLRF